MSSTTVCCANRTNAVASSVVRHGIRGTAITYFGVYLLAYVPWLWFRVMDKRLLALPHISGDLDKVNICPDARPALFLRYGDDKKVEPTLS